MSRSDDSRRFAVFWHRGRDPVMAGIVSGGNGGRRFAVLWQRKRSGNDERWWTRGWGVMALWQELHEMAVVGG